MTRPPFPSDEGGHVLGRRNAGVRAAGRQQAEHAVETLGIEPKIVNPLS
jgi:hypothetical protein